MPIINGKYISPMWKNNSPPSLNEQELNDLCKTVEYENSTDGRQIGDILLTNRTDLGNQYILCNGEAIDQSAYPALYEKLQPRGINGDFKRYKSPEGPAYSTALYVNGLYIVVRAVRGATTVDRFNVCWSNDGSNWDSSIINPYKYYVEESKLTQIVYNDGYYYFACVTKTLNNNKNEMSLYYFSISGKTLTPVGSLIIAEITNRSYQRPNINVCNGKVCLCYANDRDGGNAVSFSIQKDNSIPGIFETCIFNTAIAIGGTTKPRYSERDGFYFFIVNSYVYYATYTPGSVELYFPGTGASDIIFYNGKYFCIRLVGEYIYISSIVNITDSHSSDTTRTLAKYLRYDGLFFLKGKIYAILDQGSIPYIQPGVRLIEIREGLVFSERIFIDILLPSTDSLVNENDGVITMSEMNNIYVLNTSEKVLPLIDGAGMFPMIKALE